MNRKIIFLINPFSGTRSKSSLRKKIEQKMKGRDLFYKIAETSATGNYDHLKNIITSEQITDIIICGGDGTINKVIGALYKEPVTFGIIPMGSGNGLAFGVGIPINISKSLDLIIKGKNELIDAFSVNGKFSCMLSGLGFDALIAHSFAGKSVRGLLSYIIQTAYHFFSCKPYPFIITSGKIRIHTEAFFISIANSNQFGNKVTIAPKASLKDGLLDIVIVNKMNKLKMAWAIFWQITAGKINTETQAAENRDVYYLQVDHLNIKNPLEAPLHIDGEPEETDHEIEISVIPRAISLIVP